MFVDQIPPPPPSHIEQVVEHQYYFENPANIKIKEIAKTFRIDNFTFKTDEEKSAFVNKVHTEVSKLATPFEKHPSIVENIRDFAASTLKLNEQDFDIHALSTDAPNSRDLVYFIQDKTTKNVLYVIKTYPFFSENFMKDVNGTDRLKELKLQHSKGIKVLNIGTTKLEDKSIFMVAYSAAPGEKLSNFTKTAKTAEIPLYQLGKALSELHAKNKSSIQRKHFADKLDAELEKAQRVTPLLQSGLVDYYVAHIKAKIPDYIPSGIVHGDAHFGNFLFDPQSKTLSLIDLGELKQGIPSKDYYNILEHIEALKVDESEKEKMIEAFKKGYSKGGSRIPTQTLIDLLSLSNQLQVLGAHEWIDYYPPDTQKIVRAIIKRNYENLQNTLEKFYGPNDTNKDGSCCFINSR